jgi:hypothetical protein
MGDKLESKIQKEIIDMLRVKGWFVMNMHGSVFQSGFPDLFATHPNCGCRLIEVKKPMMKGSRFTPAQMEKFPLIIANGTPIFILTAATEFEYQKLFAHSNYWQFANGHFIN